MGTLRFGAGVLSCGMADVSFFLLGFCMGSSMGGSTLRGLCRGVTVLKILFVCYMYSC